MLTDPAIRAALKTVADEVTLRDKAGTRGGGSLALVIRRLADGGTSAQWFAMSKRAGKRTKRALGRYPDMSLADARATMREAVAPALRAGKPLRAARVSGDRPTVQRMFEAYVASMRTKGRASAGEVERMLLTCKGSAADFLGRDTLAGDVGDTEVVGWIGGFYRRGHRGAADKARAYLSAAFGWARKAGNDYTAPDREAWGVRANPVADIPKDAGARRTRDRNLAPADLAALWHASDDLATGACIRLLITCGQRVQETLRVAGSEVDLDAATWMMPAHKTKGRARPHTIPLPPQALDVLRQLKDRHGAGDLFPARTGAKGDRIDHRSVKQAIDRWLAGVAVAPFQSRDLRRTWKSRAIEAGVAEDVADLIQQHARTGTGAKVYNRADYLPKTREAMACWSRWLSNALDQSEQSIRRASRAA